MWRFFHSTSQGRRHIREGIPCQDKTAARVGSDNSYVIALADGAGSARLSHIGAQIACDTIVSLLLNTFDSCWNASDSGPIKDKMITSIVSKLTDAANEEGNQVSDYASTLLAVAIKDEKYIAVHIGDGVIGCIKNQESKVVSSPTNGEFSNVTVFITSDNVKETIKLLKGKTDEIAMFILFSDGAQQCLYNKAKNELAPAIESIYKNSFLYSNSDFQKELEITLTEVIGENTTDDCSIALIIHSDPSQISYAEMTSAEKYQLFGISSKNPNKDKRLAQLEKLVSYLQTSHTSKEIADYYHMKLKYAKKKIKYLENKGLISLINNKYKATILI